MFSDDVYSIHGENVQLVASVCDTDRMIVDKWLEEKRDYEESREFTRFDRQMRHNRGVRL